MSTQYKDYYGTHMPFGQFPKFGVLSSVKVLMTGTNIAGPFAASIMAEMGAQVIQVEAPNMPCQTARQLRLLAGSPQHLFHHAQHPHRQRARCARKTHRVGGHLD